MGDKGGPCVIAERGAAGDQLAADPRPGKADRPGLAGAGGGEAVAEEDALADLQPVGDQGGPGVVAEFGPAGGQQAADPRPVRRTAPWAA